MYSDARHFNIPLDFLLESGIHLLKPCNTLLIAKNFCFFKGIKACLPMSN